MDAEFEKWAKIVLEAEREAWAGHGSYSPAQVQALVLAKELTIRLDDLLLAVEASIPADWMFILENRVIGLRVYRNVIRGVTDPLEDVELLRERIAATTAARERVRQTYNPVPSSPYKA